MDGIDHVERHYPNKMRKCNIMDNCSHWGECERSSTNNKPIFFFLSNITLQKERRKYALLSSSDKYRINNNAWTQYTYNKYYINHYKTT